MVSNSERQYIDRIESVQRYFTRRVIGPGNLSYEDRLDILNLESLESRRIKLDLMLFFKVCNLVCEYGYLRFIQN